MKILAIESSCDETAAAVTEGREVLSNIVATQIAEHKIYGGVVPEIASRRHTEAISAVAGEALKAARYLYHSYFYNIRRRALYRRVSCNPLPESPHIPV